MKERMEAPRRSGVEGERLIADYEASGLGRKAFCAARSISASTLDYWRRRVRGRAGRSAITDSGFVELAPVASERTACEVELDLGGGVVLRIRRSA